ncbi:hypothetical protein SODALDRAFT_269415 [Sodiomyces alkalinus F11]|uniref:AAA+ ATPase domain-containing protein n=1 Tax=Sodiomyces alkalinus (strain CBS 110278 / VKM F-3762 / F11) TaxID=1314773 RepID=A0A3N2Q5A4_SODAK|nr:hypothetical protein SODALDRAFT_269415 [Sodiomyces alkalinus F11]ROT41805.1 hypothetical protein SODALDRAFT_269415 [Sodiomyces alkalinus F11]
MTGPSPFTGLPTEIQQNPFPTPNPTTNSQPVNLAHYDLPVSSFVSLSESALGLGKKRAFTIRSSSGKAIPIKQRKPTSNVSYESMVAARTKTKEGRAKRGYYGVDINDLIDTATKELADRRTQRIEPSNSNDVVRPSTETARTTGSRPRKSLLWTEKYRARTFMDLCGDDGTNRMVLRWLKRWDPLVFPGAAKKKNPIIRRSGIKDRAEEEKPHRKILMLTGPPGLGKTTLAHVCARQAGYEVAEINASDERSRDVVKNRIRTSLGTESVKTVENVKTHGDEGYKQKLARPACVIVDEVDGVVSGSGASGEGGFVKALIDLVLLDQKNSAAAGASSSTSTNRKKKKGDDFRLMRPLILICNDVYHPSLKPLRHSNLAEIIHAGKPGVEAVVSRLETIFHKEGIPCEKDAARKICEVAWGMPNGIDAKRGVHSGAEGDLRGVLVVGEWVAGRYRATASSGTPLTRKWLEKHVMQDLANGTGGARGLGRGSVKDIADRIFQEGAGFPKLGLPKRTEMQKQQHEQPRAQLGFAEHHKKHAMERLQQMIDISGEIDRIVTDVMLEYPNREFNDDSFLTKPNAAYDWIHFHDACSSRLYSSQEWELAPYLSQSLLACHHLFASPKRHVATMGYDTKWGGGDAEKEAHVLPFSGPRADFEAREAEKRNRAVLQSIQGQLGPNLVRSFRSPEDIATGFLPYLVRLVSPDVKPVMVGGGGDQKGVASVRRDAEKAIVRRAAEVLADVGITLQKGKIDGDSLFSRGPQWVYRLEPDLDALAMFETASSIISSQAPTRYAVRQVLEQELNATIARREKEARQARLRGGQPLSHERPTEPDDKENLRQKKESNTVLPVGFKKDFFGRIIETRPLQELDPNSAERMMKASMGKRKVWVTYHEGMNNAVRKPISLQELMKGM